MEEYKLEGKEEERRGGCLVTEDGGEREGEGMGERGGGGVCVIDVQRWLR